MNPDLSLAQQNRAFRIQSEMSPDHAEIFAHVLRSDSDPEWIEADISFLRVMSLGDPACAEALKFLADATA